MKKENRNETEEEVIQADESRSAEEINIEIKEQKEARTIARSCQIQIQA